MKIAIHNNNSVFSREWIEYCINTQLDYKIVDCYSTTIVDDVRDCEIVMWHHQQNDYKDLLFAKELLFALEQAGKIVYPNFKSGWHFDDKVGQMYLLQAINAPIVSSYVFYEKKDALAWAHKTKYPIVFKLRGGAGAANVILINDFRENKRIINKSFGKGHSSFNPYVRLKDSIDLFRNNKVGFSDVLKSVGRIFLPSKLTKLVNKEKGYVYYQEFLPNNDCDIRLIVIGGKRAYGMKRMVRKGDFRASGSKNFVYDKIDKEVLKIAFEVSRELELQSVAFDFIYDQNKKPKIVEISYGFGTNGSSNCKGYWDENFDWHEGKFFPLRWIIDDLKDIKNV